MTALKHELIALIAQTGPMPLSRYMAECLSHPKHGYYVKQDPLGTAGDFTTAPEISQMFGELIGLWIGDLWTRQGKPKNPRLIEFGPGRGTLMTDVHRALQKVPGWPKQTPIHFVETSPTLRKAQQEKVPTASWHTDFGSITQKGPGYIIANELFDALPIKQFEKTPDGWRERYVVHLRDETLGIVAGGPDVAPLIPPIFTAAPTGSILELCAAGQSIAASIAKRLAKAGGAALIIDYGYNEHTLGDSFQAMQHHAYVDPLEAPGDADLTAHVNFAMLKDAGEADCAVYGPTTQGNFLGALGLGMRAKTLGGDALKDAHRLAAPDEMGALFKAISFVPKDSPPPAGFQMPS